MPRALHVRDSLTIAMTDNNLSEDALTRSPPLPHGNPILDPNDNSLLGTFFTDMQTNQYSVMSYGEGLNFSAQWFGQVAPNLLCHATSLGLQPLGQPPATTYGDVYQFGQNIMPPPPTRQQQQQQQQPPPARQPPPYQLQLQPQPQPALTHYPQDVPQFFHNHSGFHVPIEQNAQVDAAALLTTLQSGRPNAYLSHTNSSNGFPPSPNTQPPRGHRSSFSLSHPTQDYSNSIGPARSNEPDTLFVDMMYGSQGSAPPPAERPQLQWGSDDHFNGNRNFVPAQHESTEVLERKRMDSMREALRIASSNPNTRASSPIGNREAAVHAISENPNGDIEVEEDITTPPRKRRKSKAKMDREDGDNTAQLPSKATARKRKSKTELIESPGSSSAMQEVSGKRRKSAPNQSKAPRENLTDAQKRENHIKSEQKRRGAIKEGFDDLNFIVPNLQNGGYSKSSVLNMTGEWLDLLIKGNQILEKHAL
ncbi:hypothetical protein E0Z10_g1689 [Xylaria hypoxylon]|uniref:BHLH domain-containing protein n=1 Tax=Xylaria hypoxylon TaxID=37992 RepID=A0A4Z0Z6L5_9PEZI|nr:hypothetical protein E0Z10_g1689 [Xylaria hypoxylon]